MRGDGFEAEERRAAPMEGEGEWPLVGRAREVGLMEAALADRRGVVLVGEAGTGKTRLASEVVAASTTEGVRWHAVIGSQGVARVPLGAWAHLLPSSWEPGGDDVATWRLLATGLDRTAGMIHLFVDDAQWLDPVSAGLVHHLVATGQAKAVVTVRRHEPVGQPVTALWKDGHLRRLDLDQVDARLTTAILEAALRAPIEPRTARRLHERSAGNVLMLRELVAAGRADGNLQLRHGAWVQHEAGGPSPRLIDLLADRVDELEPDERAGVELVAVAEPVSAEVLDAALGPELVGRLLARRLVEVDGVGASGAIRSSHPLLGEVLVARMDARRRTETVRRLVELHEAAGLSTDADRLRIAVWRLDAGLPIDGAAARQAAELALARSDFPLAEALARVALDDGADAEATILLGEALHHQQRSAEADSVFASIAEQVPALDPSLRLRYAEGRAVALSTDLGRLDDAIVVLQETLDSMPEGQPSRALESRLAFVLADRGHLRAAAPYAEARMAELDEDELAALGAITAFAMIRTMAGRGRDALAALDAMVPVALRHLDAVPAGLGWIAAQRMLALYFLGELAEAAEFSAMVEAMVLDDPDPTRRAAVLMVRGMLAADRGELDEALRLLRQSAALHDVDNRRGYQSWTFAILARVLAQRGQLDEAEDALDQARRTYWPAGQVFVCDLDAAAIWIEARRGRLGAAEEILVRAIADAEAEGMAQVPGYLRFEAVRAGLPAGPHVAPLAQVVATDQGRRAVLWHAHVRALAQDDAAGLVESGHRFAALGANLHAAEAYALGAGAHRRSGSPALAAQAKELSRQQRALCPGARTPALDLGDVVVGLTRRELDVAARAAEGLMNHEIADALGISVRTVETHLQRAFQKLGVNRRSDLASLLQPG